MEYGIDKSFEYWMQKAREAAEAGDFKKEGEYFDKAMAAEEDDWNRNVRNR